MEMVTKVVPVRAVELSIGAFYTECWREQLCGNGIFLDRGRELGHPDKHQIEARVDTGVDGAAAEAALRILRGRSTHDLEVALGLELASPPLLRLDRTVVRTIPPSPPPRPPASPPLPPPPVRATRRLTTRRGSTACH